MQQTLFNFDETFRRKLKAVAKRRGVSIKTIVEEAVWPVIKDEDIFDEEISSFRKPVAVSKDILSIGMSIPPEERARRMAGDSRFADIMSL